MTSNWRPVLPGLLRSWPSSEVLHPLLPVPLTAILLFLHLYSWWVVLVSFLVMDLPDILGARSVYHRVFLEQEYDGDTTEEEEEEEDKDGRPRPDFHGTERRKSEKINLKTFPLQEKLETFLSLCFFLLFPPN